MVDSTIRVAPPEEKLMLRAQQAREFGKEFDELKERAVINQQLIMAGKPTLAPLDRAPINIKANPMREKMMREEDARGIEELKREAARASEEDQRRENEILRSQLEALQRQVAQLTGKPVAETPPAAPVPAPSPEPAAAPDGMPDESWSRKAIVDWLSANEFPVPDRSGITMSKMAVLEFAQTEIAKREAPGAAVTHGSVEIEAVG